VHNTVIVLAAFAAGAINSIAGAERFFRFPHSSGLA